MRSSDEMWDPEEHPDHRGPSTEEYEMWLSQIVPPYDPMSECPADRDFDEWMEEQRNNWISDGESFTNVVEYWDWIERGNRFGFIKETTNDS